MGTIMVLPRREKMTKELFSPYEWNSLVNAPHWIYVALAAGERGAISTRRTEAKALDEFLSNYKTQSPLVKEIIAGQKEADDKLGGSLEDAERMLGQMEILLDRKVGEEEGNAFRDMLMQAATAVAKATREAIFGDAISATEEKTLARIQTALKATEADKRRRHEAAAASEAAKLAQQAKEAQAQAEAQKKADEAKRLAAEAEAKRRMQETEAKRLAAEAEAKRKAAEAAAQQAAAAAAQQAAAPAAQTGAAGAAADSAGTMRIYVVKPGDTLSGIAQQMYGKAGRWREIYEANKDVIKKPNLIRPGWKLRIPD
jgi:uncharacterized membrane protein YqiK